jgi:outer membrane protein OmpA-like peptidoglycan-associated protein
VSCLDEQVIAAVQIVSMTGESKVLEKVRTGVFSIVLWVLSMGQAATLGAAAPAESESLPGVATVAIDEGTQAADAMFARGAVSSAVGGAGYYIDQVEEPLSVFPELLLLRVKHDVLVVRIDPEALFRGDSTNMHVVGRTLLSNMAEKLMFLKKTAIVIQVHTGTTGDEKRNLRFSERRAKSIKNHLEGYNLAAKRMVAFGYGDRYALPVASGQSSARVNILLKARSQ